MPQSDSEPYYKKKKKNLQKFCTVFTVTTKIIHSELGMAILMVMICVSILIPYWEWWGSTSCGSSQREVWPLATSLWPQRAFVCFSWDVLRSSMDRQGSLNQERLLLHLSTTQFINSVIPCFVFYLLGSFLAKAGRMDPHIGSYASRQPSREKTANIEMKLDGWLLSGSTAFHLLSWNLLLGKLVALFSVLLVLPSSPFQPSFKNRHFGGENAIIHTTGLRS